MRWVRCFGAALFLVVGAVPALADEPATIKVKISSYSSQWFKEGRVVVKVREWPGRGGKPVAEVRPTGPDTGSTEATVTDSKATPLPPGTYEVSVELTDRTSATQIVHLGAGEKLELALNSSKAKSLGYETGQQFKNVEEYKASGNTGAYQNAADDIRNGINQDERLATEAQAAADAFARANGLRVTDLAGAEKDLRNIEKLGNLADQQVKQNIERYIEKLRSVDGMRYDVDEKKKRFAELGERRFSLAPPSACREGESGGLLAGGINSVFGTDLAGVCDEEQQRRRDTDRPAGDKRDKHERKD